MTRQEASRLNGAKSRGPKTEEGKKRSCLSRICRGLTSNTLILPGESVELFNRVEAEYLDEYKPQTATERDLLSEAIACTWRLRRAYSNETSLIEVEMHRQQDEVDDEYEECPPEIRIALAFEKLADQGKSLALNHRYETRLRRTKERALAELRRLIEKRTKDLPPSAQFEKLPFEPEPSESTHGKPANPQPIPSPVSCLPLRASAADGR